MADPTPAPSPSAFGTQLWSSPDWLEGALGWLDAAGIQRTGRAEQPHLRPWATALRVPTSRGTYWLKAASPGTSFEIRLYPLLQRVVPDWVLAPLAVDLERSWIVLPDGGTTLGDSVPDGEIVSALQQILPQYAELQLKLAPHAGEMLALGLTDMRAAMLPQRLEEALREATDYVRREGSAEDAALLARLRDAYLEPFSGLAPRAQLVEAVELACHAAKAARALTWARALRTLSPEEARRFARAPLRWVGCLLDADYLGIGA